VRRQLQEDDQDEVERVLVRHVVAEIRLDPVDLDAELGGAAARTLERHGGDVDAGHPPASFGQPDGVPHRAAGEIERPAGREAGELADEDPVRSPCPRHHVGLEVPAVPVLAFHRQPGYSSSRTYATPSAPGAPSRRLAPLEETST